MIFRMLLNLHSQFKFWTQDPFLELKIGLLIGLTTLLLLWVGD